VGSCISRTSLNYRAIVWALLLIIFFCGTAYAHPVAQGGISIIRDDHSLTVQLRVSTEQIAVWNSYNADDLGDNEEAILKSHAAYLRKHFKLRISGEEIEIPELFPKDNSASETSMRGFSMVINHPELKSRCWPDCSVELYQDFLHEFEYAPGNKWEAIFAVEEPGGGSPLLLRSMQWLAISEYGEKSTLADTFKNFFGHGLHHIMSGYDHLLFISALILGAASFWRMVVAVTFFTLAHTITLILSVLRIIVVPQDIVEPIIAASIIVVALLNFSKRSRRISYIPAFCFGLFHGLGFAQGLIESLADIPNVVLTSALLGFSIGIEFGHQIVIIALFGLLYFIRKLRGPGVSEITPIYLRNIFSIAIALAGVFYFMTAIGFHFPGH
jgi:hydrogenase/urease accessory protein HupE